MSELSDPLTEKTKAAFRQAMRTVLRDARAYDTPIAIWEDGGVKEISPDEFERRVNESQAE